MKYRIGLNGEQLGKGVKEKYSESKVNFNRLFYHALVPARISPFLSLPDLLCIILKGFVFALHSHHVNGVLI